ncbi:MAG: hypothetical protein ACRDOH_07595 [Streptosporangiaceae bacterium]
MSRLPPDPCNQGRHYGSSHAILAIGDLEVRERERGLSAGERRMLDKAAATAAVEWQVTETGGARCITHVLPTVRRVGL